MKKNIFPKIIYYLFTFVMGILLAFGLFGYHVLFEIPQLILSDMNGYLAEGSYDKAMELVGGYFNRDYVYQHDFDNGGGVVLFEAITPADDQTDQDSQVRKMHKSYAGFLYGVKGLYDVNGEENNRTMLVVTNLDGDVRNVQLLDTDLNENEIPEGISTVASQGLLYLDLDLGTYHSLGKLQFYDAKGSVFREVDLSLDYSGAFFTDVDEFYSEYNRDGKSDKLESLGTAFLAKNERYAMSIRSEHYDETDVKGILIVLAYFAVIYIIADFLVGRHYILRFCRWLHYKTPWGQKSAARRAEKASQQAFGHDYFSQVTMSLDLSELPGFSESVQVRYSRDGEEIAFTLLKENGYTAIERVKAGLYVNAWMDINRDYAPTDMPDNLIVEGYKMDVNIKIIKRKEESV